MFFSFLPKAEKLKYLICSIIAGIVFPVIFVSADYDLNQVCGNEGWKSQCQTLSTSDCQNLLNQCQTYFNDKMTELESTMTQTASTNNTLKNQVAALNNKIKDLNYQIYQANLSIKSLSFQVSDTEQSITDTTGEIESEKAKIGLLIQAVGEEDNKSFLEILLSSKTLSDFFDNLVYLQTLSAKNQEMLSNFQTLQTTLENQKVSLEEQKGEQESILSLQSLQKNEASTTKTQVQQLQTLTEAQYQSQLKQQADLKTKKAEIAAKLIQLVGLAEGTVAPSFGDALQMAQTIGASVGVRPAFLLAIISQESAIGKNVGQCYVTNTKTGGGVYSNGKLVSRIMHPTRDLPEFLSIINSVGRTMTKTPVSCWIPDCVYLYKGSYYHSSASVLSDGSISCSKSGYSAYGFGGAMGPAQFIPSTWALYEDKIKAQTGKSTTDPWSIKDSFTASALYLKDLGGGKQSGEFSAASRYYGGSSSYANSVATRAWCIQDYITNGSMTDYCQGLIF
jgi:peptidoglycan hydrolase CwlO-like protein